MSDHQTRTMREAFAGILKGDYSKRDAIFKDMERAKFMDAKERVLEKLKEIDFFVGADGAVMMSKEILRVAL
jgi:hypothetical protein